MAVADDGAPASPSESVSSSDDLILPATLRRTPPPRAPPRPRRPPPLPHRLARRTAAAKRNVATRVLVGCGWSLGGGLSGWVVRSLRGTPGFGPVVSASLSRRDCGWLPPPLPSPRDGAPPLPYVPAGTVTRVLTVGWHPSRSFLFSRHASTHPFPSSPRALTVRMRGEVYIHAPVRVKSKRKRRPTRALPPLCVCAVVCVPFLLRTPSRLCFRTSVGLGSNGSPRGYISSRAVRGPPDLSQADHSYSIIRRESPPLSRLYRVPPIESPPRLPPLLPLAFRGASPPFHPLSAFIHECVPSYLAPQRAGRAQT